MKYFLYTLLATLAFTPQVWAADQSVNNSKALMDDGIDPDIVAGYVLNNSQVVIVDKGDGKAAEAYAGKGARVVMVMENTFQDRVKGKSGNAMGGMSDGKFRIITASSEQGIGASMIVDEPPSEWLSCNADTDCVATNFACKDIAVNKTHEHSFEKTAAVMGFRIDPSICMKTAYQKSKAPPEAKCLKDVRTGFVTPSTIKPPPRCVIDHKGGGGIGIQIKTSPPILP